MRVSASGKPGLSAPALVDVAGLALLLELLVCGHHADALPEDVPGGLGDRRAAHAGGIDRDALERVVLGAGGDEDAGVAPGLHVAIDARGRVAHRDQLGAVDRVVAEARDEVLDGILVAADGIRAVGDRGVDDDGAEAADEADRLGEGHFGLIHEGGATGLHQASPQLALGADRVVSGSLGRLAVELLQEAGPPVVRQRLEQRLLEAQGDVALLQHDPLGRYLRALRHALHDRAVGDLDLEAGGSEELAHDVDHLRGAGFVGGLGGGHEGGRLGAGVGGGRDALAADVGAAGVGRVVDGHAGPHLVFEDGDELEPEERLEAVLASGSIEPVVHAEAVEVRGTDDLDTLPRGRLDGVLHGGERREVRRDVQVGVEGQSRTWYRHAGALLLRPRVTRLGLASAYVCFLMSANYSNRGNRMEGG